MDAKQVIFQIMYENGGFYSHETRAVLRKLSCGNYSHTQQHVKIEGVIASLEEYETWVASRN